MKFLDWLKSFATVSLIAVFAGCSKQLTQQPAMKLTSDPQLAQQTTPAPFASKPDPRAAANIPNTAPELEIPAGTALTVRLQTAVSSATSHAGDEFAATLDQPIVVDGKTLAPEGADVTGRVLAARHSGRLMHRSYLRVALESVTVDGKKVALQTSSVMLAGASHRRRNLAWIGGGAGGGALIGVLAGGAKGALIGSAIGAASGTTAAFATGKKDVGFAPERRLTFRTTRPVTAG